MIKQTLAVKELDPARFQTMIDDRIVGLYTLRNHQGMVVKITNYGAKIEQIIVPDRHGIMGDVILGYDNIDSVITGQPSMNAFIGRFANRIAHSTFMLQGTRYQVTTNNGVHSLHGGIKGSRFRVFLVRQISERQVEMSYVFKDGEEGYPGTLVVQLNYTLDHNNELGLTWQAQALDKATVANFTSHVFFNLSGDVKKTILETEVAINADKFLPIDQDLIPTSEQRSVMGTPMDFRTSKPIGRDIKMDDEQLKRAGGYDHHFVLNKTESTPLNLAASAYEPLSGRTLEVMTSEPGMQFFSGNGLDGSIPKDQGKNNQTFVFRGGFCFEPSHFPNAPNEPSFPSTELAPGEQIKGSILYKFGIRR